MYNFNIYSFTKLAFFNSAEQFQHTYNPPKPCKVEVRFSILKKGVYYTLREYT